jgi:arylsulfatase
MSGIRPKNCAPLAQILKLNGYSTAQMGKCHEVLVWETSEMGPFDGWPTGGGFEHFYGFFGAETDYYRPDLYKGTTPIEPPKTPEEGYIFDEDIADHAIEWMQQQKALMPDKPFFIYFAPGGTHAPHAVPKEWSDKYKGKFNQGWDKLREEIFARQKKLGVIPADAELTARPKEIPAWDEMPEALKPVLARQMEVYAGYMEHTDYQVGRVVNALQDLKILDDTLIIYITGDNGACVGGGLNGTFNWMITVNGALGIETPEFMASRIDKFGTPDALNHYAVGWAHALDTPYQWTKMVASHWGGTRNGSIVHWPNGFKARGEIRTHFSHVIDVAATVLDAAGIPEPAFVNGIRQTPLQGQRMIPSFTDAGVPEFRETQYFEMFGNRGIYHQGWTACTKHGTPWVMWVKLPELDDDVWELYGPDDWTQAHNLAKQMPEKLRELQRRFLIEAVRYNVLPIDDRKTERFNPEIAGRPGLIRGNTQILYSGMRGLPENIVLNIKNKSHAVTAEVVVPKGGATGVIIAQGGMFGGWSIYVRDGYPVYCYNLYGLERTKIVGKNKIPTGKHQFRMEFTYDGGGLGKGGKISLYTDGELIGEGRIERSTAVLFSLDDKTNVGCDRGTPISDDYMCADSEFNGQVKWI